jgi:hypothetical protein
MISFGAASVIGGITLGAPVSGFSLAEHGWGAIDTIGLLALGATMLVLFVAVESRVAQLLLRVVTDGCAAARSSCRRSPAAS